MKNHSARLFKFQNDLNARLSSIVFCLLVAGFVSSPLHKTNAQTQQPCLRVTKLCDTVTIGQPNLVTAVVTNCGNLPITSITVTDNIYGNIGFIDSLAPTGSTNLTKSVTNTSCGNFTNVVTANGLVFGESPISASSTNVCVTTENPCLVVTKTCNTVTIGQGNLVTALVTNCGNVTLTNITVSDNLYGSIGFIASLAPNGSTNLTKSVTNTTCGNFPNTVTAIGLSPCKTSVTNTSTATCVVNSDPCLTVSKNCDTVTIGQPNTVSGAVTNCGNITITNITISDNVYGTLATIPSLAPGAFQTYSRLVTNNSCGNFPNTVTANGTTVCGQPMAAQANGICVVTANPCLRVTKTCDTVTIGQPNTVTALVTNCGNVAVNNISVTDNLYGSLGIIPLLAPGTAQTLTKVVTNTTCGNFTNVVTASGISPCGSQPLSAEDGGPAPGTFVQAQSTNVCVVTSNPCLGVTKTCNTVTIGQPNTVTAVVTNCGNVTLTSISVSDNLYGNIGFIASLAPGGSTNLTKVVTNTCGNFTNVVTATGTNSCGGAVLFTENFNAGNGGFTVDTPVAYDGPWVYSAGSGSWTEAGQQAQNGHPNTSTLISPVIGVSQAGTLQLTFTHRYSFEPDNFDGGQVQLSVNGGAFTAVPLAAFTQNGYNGAVNDNSLSVLANQPAYVTNSPNFAGTKLISIATLGSFQAGDSIRVAFIAANDASDRGQFQPSWEIDDVTIASSQGAQVQAQSTAVCVVTENPCIRVTKTCDTVVVGQANLVTAVVTNCGNVALHGITVVDNIYGSIGTVALLAPGGTATLTKSVTNTCGNFPNTVTAIGLSPCNTSVTNTSTATCVVTESPCIRVTKTCDTVVVGQANLVTAVVTNCGNVALHGITVVDNIYGSVGTIASLAPGGTATLTKSVTNTCGNFPNTVTAIGLSPCNTSVTNTSTATCVVTESPCIRVTKTCDTVVIGQANLVTAVVTNCGNIALHGITVVDNIYGSVGTIASLAPGGTATLTKSVTNTCGNFPNTVTAIGLSPCNTSVTNTSTATCVVTENPCIRVTKTCDTVVVGQANLVTAVVTNCGNVALHGITVVDNIYGSVGTIASLAPGGTATLTKSVTNTCGNFPNTVTAIGLSPCNTSVTNTSTATCVVTESPCIRVTKTCDTVVAGQANLVTAVVTNCGNVALHGITVVDNIYGSVGTIASLAPGGTATLTKSVTNTCGNFPNTVTAIGLSPCNTSVTNTSTATCVVTENPCIRVTKTCNTVNSGQANTVTAVVTNCGNVTLTNITVTDNLYGTVGSVASLAPGGTATLTKLVTNTTCGNFTNVVTASGASPCGTPVTARATNVCTVLDNIPPTINCPINAIVVGNDPQQCSASVAYQTNATDNCCLAGFTCAPPSGSVFPVGTTTVTCTAVDCSSNSASCSFDITVEDREAPVGMCIQGVNPSGGKIPVAGKNPASGQNPDGYYQLSGKDNCDSNASIAIFLFDTGSSFVAGPFVSGDVIKLTQSPGKTPSQDPAPAPIVAHLHFKGDGLLFIVDVAGNISEGQLCLVPRPPK